VLEQYPSDWLVEHFFLETLGVSYELICDILVTSWAGDDALQFEDVEFHIIKVSKSHHALSRNLVLNGNVRSYPKASSHSGSILLADDDIS
jgi:hypothetical protein